MITVDLKDCPEVKRVILAAFPSYKKRRAFISEFSDQHGVNINSYWDGGSKSEFALVALATMQRKEMPSQSHPFYDVERAGMANTENQDVAVDHVGNIRLKRLPEGIALVEAGYFCSKAATAHVYFAAANMAKLLPAPAPELNVPQYSDTSRTPTWHPV